MKQLAGQFELFAPSSAMTTKRRTSNGITWAIRHVRITEWCEHCIANLLAGEAETSRSRQAKWRRTHNGLHTYLCSVHAQDQRERDALTPRPEGAE